MRKIVDSLEDAVEDQASGAQAVRPGRTERRLVDESKRREEREGT